MTAADTSPTRIHVLWASARQPELALANCEELGLTISHLDAAGDAPPLKQLLAELPKQWRDIHFLLLVTDVGGQASQEVSNAICQDGGRIPTLHLELADSSAQAYSACTAIRALCKLLNTQVLVGMDVEDVKAALAGLNPIRVGLARASGAARATEALNLALQDTGCTSDALQGLLLVFSGAAGSLSLKEAGSAIGQVRPSFGADMSFLYGLLQDDALAESLQVIAFAG